MKLVYRIPLITGIILILTALVNVVAFQILSEKYFEWYISELATTDNTPDPEKLQAFLKLWTLDRSTREEYASIIAELSNLSTSLENISKNPELYMSNKTWSWDSQIALPVASPTEKNFFPTLNVRAFWEDTPEWRFATNTLKWLLWVNSVWLFIILISYFTWIRSIFWPIWVVTENIKNIIDRKKYASIRYGSYNEFSPLISTINSLHKSLSIQEKIRSDFLSDLSHEIRTPITAVQCYLEAIEDGMMKFDLKTQEMLQKELTRLIHITWRIMDYEHLTSDAFDHIHVERFSAEKSTEDLVLEYTPQLEKNNQKVILDLPQDTLTSMDPGMYAQILHNIFSNFIKYAGINTILNISYSKNKDFYIFSFADNGIGIPEEELVFVREKFYRIDKSRTQKDGSMWIGLSIIDRIARLHRWTLEIQKNSPKWVHITVKIGR